MAAEALLEIDLHQGNWYYCPLAYILADNEKIKKFETVYGTTEVKEGFRFDDILSDLGNKLEKRQKQIEKNLETFNRDVPAKELYTAGIEDVGFSTEAYNLFRHEIIQEQKKKDTKELYQLREQFSRDELPYKKYEAFKSIFKCLETDNIFLNQVLDYFATEFYIHIDAETYFISSGSENDHPHPSVVNGIIKAANKRHAADKSYQCRLLLTSAKNIKASLLPAFNFEWKYVSFQYFLGTTASVSIDPNVSPCHVLDGCMEWDGPQNLSASLFKQYNLTAGARALKRERTKLETCKYEIKSCLTIKSWLHFTDYAELELSNTPKSYTITNAFIKKKEFEDEWQIKLISGNNMVFISGLAGYHLKGAAPRFKLFVRRNGKREYLVDENGTLYYRGKNDATYVL